MFSQLKVLLKSALCYGLILCIILTSSAFFVNADTSRPIPIDPDNYWGRTQLSGLSNSKALLYAYDKLAEGVEQCKEEISVCSFMRGYYLTLSEFNTVLHAYLRDYPHHFWVGNAYSYRENTNDKVTSFIPTYILTGDALTAARNAFDEEVEKVLSHITTDMTEAQREKYIHDYLAEKITYAGGTTHAHNAYGALVEGKSVCEGYAESFQYLLYQAGILCATVTGKGYSSDSSDPELHAWSLVRIDGEYYYVDLTWNDQDVATFYTYYNITTEDLLRDHVLDVLAYSYPDCTATAENYFVRYGGALNSFDLQKVINVFHRDGYYAQVRITDESFDFWTAFSQNRSAVSKGINLIGSPTYRCYLLLDVRVVVIDGQRRGDVNGDDKMDDADLTALLGHIDGTTPITDSTLLKAADVDQDGTVDLRDHQRLYQHLQEIRYISPTGQNIPKRSENCALLTLQPSIEEIPAEEESHMVTYSVILTPPAEGVTCLSATVKLPQGMKWMKGVILNDITDRVAVAKIEDQTLMLSGVSSSLSAETAIAELQVSITDCTIPQAYQLTVSQGMCGSDDASHPLAFTCKNVTVTPASTPSDPDVSEPDVSEPDVSEPDVSEPDVSEPDVSEPDVSEPDISQPDVSKPDVSEPDVSEPAVSEPDVSEPDTSEPDEPDYTRGDLDGNREVTATDALMVLKSIVGKLELNTSQCLAADLDGDGKINAADALIILKIVVGKIVL